MTLLVAVSQQQHVKWKLDLCVQFWSVPVRNWKFSPSKDYSRPWHSRLFYDSNLRINLALCVHVLFRVALPRDEWGFSICTNPARRYSVFKPFHKRGSTWYKALLSTCSARAKRAENVTPTEWRPLTWQGVRTQDNSWEQILHLSLSVDEKIQQLDREALSGLWADSRQHVPADIKIVTSRDFQANLKWSSSGTENNQSWVESHQSEVRRQSCHPSPTAQHLTKNWMDKMWIDHAPGPCANESIHYKVNNWSACSRL